MSEIELQVFSDKLKELRQSLNMTQQEFVSDIGITASALSAYEKNQKTPSIGVVKRIAEKYNISIDWLCGLSDKKQLSDIYTTYGEIAAELFKIDDSLEVTFDDIKISEYKSYTCILFEDSVFDTFLQEWKDATNVLYNTSINKAITKDMYLSWKKSKLEELSKKKLKKRRSK